MWQVPDLRLTWVLGAILILLGGLGAMLAGTAIGLPILVLMWAFGQSLGDGIKWIGWASPLWAPLGLGMGMQVTVYLFKGIRGPTRG